MNSSITFPPHAPSLKLARPSAEKWAATVAEERRRLQEDQEALREREINLREYEARLRALQAEIEAVRSPAPSADTAGRHEKNHAGVSRSPCPAPSSETDTTLHTGWEKLHRAREILEAEQNHLRDDRIAMRELESAVKRREEAVSAREVQLAEREALLVAAMPELAAAPQSAISRLTTAPFKIARAVLGAKK